ncbi:MAG TPA: NUDIX domain-containing protein [Candidatus Babeliales bacterium]|nr:NUDIX domain-containing protein [Candidatus Babeliales bacterium]
MKNIFKLPAYVGIILSQNHKVLLVQRHNTDWMSGYWNFPGGLLEENETLTSAAAREIHEEVNVIVDPADFTLAHVIHVRANNKNTQDIIGIYFIAHSWHGTPINNEPHRHSDMKWFDSNQLPNNVTEHAILVIQQMTTDKKYSENG